MTVLKHFLSKLVTAAPRVLVLTVALGFLAVSGAPAQQGQGGGQDDGARAELRKVTQKIRQIRQKALKDSVLAQRRLQLQEMLQKAMKKEDPETQKRQERMTEIQSEIQKAQKNQETSKLRSLFSEYQQLRQKNQQVQRKVMKNKKIAKALNDFRVRVREKMKEIDPSTKELLARQDSLLKEVQAERGGGRRGGGAPGGGQPGGGGSGGGGVR